MFLWHLKKVFNLFLFFFGYTNYIGTLIFSNITKNIWKRYELAQRQSHLINMFSHCCALVTLYIWLWIEIQCSKRKKMCLKFFLALWGFFLWLYWFWVTKGVVFSHAQWTFLARTGATQRQATTKVFQIKSCGGLFTKHMF